MEALLEKASSVSGNITLYIDQIVTGKLNLADMFCTALDEAPPFQQIKRNVECLDRQGPSLLEEIELHNLTSESCRMFEAKIEFLLGQSGDSALEDRQRELKHLVKFSKVTKLKEEAKHLGEDIKSWEDQLQSANRNEEQSRGPRHPESAKSSASSDSGPHEKGLARHPLESILGEWRRLLKEKSAQHGQLEILLRTSRPAHEGESDDEGGLEMKKLEVYKLQRKLTWLDVLIKSISSSLGGKGSQRISRDDGRSLLNDLEHRIDSTKTERALAECGRRELDSAYRENKDRLQSISAIKAASEAELAEKEVKFGSLRHSESLKELEIEKLRELHWSGHEFDCLEMTLNSSLLRNHSYILRSTESILEVLGVQDRSGWHAFGYFGTVLDHIDTDPDNRSLLHPLKDLLSSFLVRDQEVGWKIRNELRKLEFCDSVRFISVGGWKASKGRPDRRPEDTASLSSFLKIREPYRKIYSDEILRSDLRKIITEELADYYVIPGDRAQALECAHRYSMVPEWDSCTFVIEDGTCSGRYPMGAASGEDPIVAYGALCAYWDSLNDRIDKLQVESDGLMGAARNYSEEILQLRRSIQEQSRAMASVQLEIQKIEATAGCLECELSELDDALIGLAEQLDCIAVALGDGKPYTLRLELLNQLERLGEVFELVRENQRRIDDQICATISALANSHVQETAQDTGEVVSKSLKYEISELESDIASMESFVAAARRDETEFAAKDGSEGHDAADRPRLPESGEQRETIEARTTLFLLRKKLGDVQEKVAAFGEMDRPQNWSDRTNYEEELEQVTRKLRDNAGVWVPDRHHEQLDGLLRKAPKPRLVSEGTMETLSRIFDVSREKNCLGKIEEDAADRVLEGFREKFLQLAPRGEIRISESFKKSIMRKTIPSIIVLLVYVDLSAEDRRQLGGGSKPKRDPLRAFNPWFPEAIAPRGRQAENEDVVSYPTTERPRAREDLNPIFDKLLKIAEIADPLVPNMNISQMGVDIQLRWMSGLSTVKRSNDVLYYDNYGPDTKAIEFNVRTKDVRVYLTYQVGTFSFFYTYSSNGSVYMDEIDVRARFAFNTKTNHTTFDTLKITDRTRLRMDLNAPGQDIFTGIVEGFFSKDVDNKILPAIKQMIQYELSLVNILAVLEKLSPGAN
ncbi:uncharacterized protein LOC108864818 [Galendromus occidentalis]|uniref:Uncharacterized protein LOC108864818 n=1 Tax=Galendromus occidentalis TaxID=34638 RepID=A0AAJ7PB29_9ACAR|nr:uncharacterized protein LOC108864818 [Galendromus occidentalis]